MTLRAPERQLLVALGVLVGLYLLFEVALRAYAAILLFGDVVVIFIAAWAISYLLMPPVRAMERGTRLNRLGSVLVAYVAVAVVLTAILALAIPALAGQLQLLATDAPRYGEAARDTVLGIQDGLNRSGVPVDLVALYGSLPVRIAELSGDIARDALGLVQATAGILFNITLVLIIGFILLLDGDLLWRRFLRLLSPKLRADAELFHQSVDRSFGGFIRGSLLLGLFYGGASLLYLVPLAIPFAGLLAVIAGLAVMVPFFGPIIAMVPVVAVTALAATDRLIPIFLITLALQQVTLNIAGPRIMANAVGIHPLFVFFALLVGSRIGGFWGVLLAMPLAGIVSTLLRYVYDVRNGRRERSMAALKAEGTETMAGNPAGSS